MLARPAPTSARRFDASGLTMLLVAALVLCGLTASAPPARVHATGAVGLVIRHGDGRVLYAYIPLTGDQITGAEALMQAGLPLDLQASSSLGAAVCAIDGEGCEAPKEDCFCKSYGDPAYYWHYYIHRPNGAWANASLGAGNRVLHDGDVDGWSWTAGDSGLPTVTLAQIAALVQSPATVAPPSPPPSGTSPETTHAAAPAPAAPTPLPGPTPTAVTVTATATPGITAAPPAAAAVPIASPIVPATLPPSPFPPLPSLPAPSVITETQPRAVVVGPDGTRAPVRIAPPATRAPATAGGRTFGIFAAVALGMLVLLAVAPLGARRRRRGGAPPGGSQ